jgi:hypothetical protein
LFVLLLIALFGAFLCSNQNVLFLIPPLGYLLMLLVASVSLALRRGRPDCAFALPIVFATLHLSYGTGTLVGASQNISAFIASRLRRPGRFALACRDAEPESRTVPSNHGP